MKEKNEDWKKWMFLCKYLNRYKFYKLRQWNVRSDQEEPLEPFVSTN